MIKSIVTREKGITLIALVVTIIVLLILAGISIQMLTGQNGILNRAEEASYKSKLAELKENLQLDIVDEIMKKTGDDLNKEELREILVKYFGEENVPELNDAKWDNFPEGFILRTEDGKYEVDIAEIYDISMGKLEAGTETTKPEGKEWGEKVTPVADGKGNIIPVPEGFSYKEGTKETGFVIEDGEGNEFVWIPCGEGEDEVVYERKNELAATWKTATEGDVAYNTKEYQYTEFNDWKDNGGDTTSVDTYGGFYIGRYEAGIPSTASFYKSKNGDEYIRTTAVGTGRDVIEEAGKKLKPVSKKNNPSWNMITQKNAVEVSKAMYEGSESVTSKLVDSYAWDTIVEWIKKGPGAVSKVTESTSYGNYYNNTNISLRSNSLYAMHVIRTNKGNNVIAWQYATKYFIGPWKRTASNKEITAGNIDTEYGKYEWNPSHEGWNYETYRYNERTEIATGASEATKTKNIYDLAGNMWEWTTETGKHNGGETTFAVIRGGSFANSGSDSSVCTRYGNCNNDNYINPNIGFRVVLYLQ